MNFMSLGTKIVYISLRVSSFYWYVNLCKNEKILLKNSFCHEGSCQEVYSRQIVIYLIMLNFNMLFNGKKYYRTICSIHRMVKFLYKE